MKLVLSILFFIVFIVLGISFAESEKMLNAAIVIFSGSFVLYMKDNYYDIKSIIITLCMVIAGTLIFTGENLFYIATNCLAVFFFVLIAGKADFNTCKLFFTIFSKRITKVKRLESDSCNECRFHDMKLEAGDCRIFGLIPTGIKWSQKTCGHCSHFQQGEIIFLNFKTRYGKLLGFYKVE